MTDLLDATALVTGAGRGFGRAIARTLAGAGARVVGLARSADQLDAVRQELGERFLPVAADATDAAVAAELTRRHQPSVLVLNAGARTPLSPLPELTWEEFERNWAVDTRHAFVWTREALTAPLAPGSTVVVISSGAALRGSPISGGYAGAKATIRFIAAYAASEASDAGMGIRFVTLFPLLTPATEFGAAAVAAYAARQGLDADAYAASMQPFLTPEMVGAAVLEVALGPADAAEYLLTGEGMRVVP